MASIAMNTSPVGLGAPAANGYMLSAGNGLHSSQVALQWSPSEETLSAIINLVKESTTANSKVQNIVYSKLQTLAMHRDFNNYLVYILARGCNAPNTTPQQLEGIRQAAGLLLKSNIRLLYPNLHLHTREYINAQLLTAIGDTSNIVRPVAATCISTIVVSTNHIGAYAGLINTLVQCLDSNRPTYLDGALTVLSQLAEDVPNLLDRDASRPLDALLPKIIHFCHHETNSVRARALQILNHLILVMPSSLRENVDVFCQTLFSRAEDSSAQVRKRVCTAICLLLEVMPNALGPYMNSIVQYMLISSEHPDEFIAKEATEFWTLLASTNGAAELLRPVLPRLIPIFLKNMVYSIEDVAILDAGDVGNGVMAEMGEDLRPRFHQPRLKETFSGGRANGSDHIRGGDGSLHINGNSTSDANTNGKRTEEEDSSDDEDDWDDLQDMGESNHNLRKCSANSMDVFANLFKDEILDIVLPGIQEKMMDSERWEQRECGVLALGAIAQGCYNGIVRHMRSVFPFLVHSVSDKHYMVRTISCWTLARYTKWVVGERDEALMLKLLNVLLEHMLDENKKVQKAACSSVEAVFEEYGSYLSSYTSHILKPLSVAFERYQQSNIVILFDVVSTLAITLGSEIGNPELLNVLMPILISRWNAMSDFDPLMLSLLECLGNVFRAMGTRSQQFAANLFSRCAGIMDSVYTKEARGEREDNDVDFLTCSLDLMGALTEALGPSVEQYVATNGGNGNKSILPIFFVCMKDGRQEVRQSAFALLGDFARFRIPSLIPALPEYVNGTVEAMNPEYMSVSNNATWALGELALMAGFLPPAVPLNREAIKRILLDGALDCLIRMVNIPQLNKSLLENSALTLGRMGLVLAEAVAPRLGQFAKAVFASLRNIRDDVEKEQAFRGMNAMVKLNPMPICECFVYYVDAIASWFHCKADLEMEFATILGGYKATLGDQWFSLYNSLPGGLQTLLKERFAL